VIHTFDIPELFVEAAAKERNGDVVVLLRGGLLPARRRELLRELLKDEELAMLMSQPVV
jgi:hypothetical protein